MDARYELPNLLRTYADAEPSPSVPSGGSLSVAGLCSVYDVSDVDDLAEDSLSRNEALRSVYGKMKHVGELRYVVKPGALSALDALHKSCPSFRPVIDDIKKQLALAISGNQPVSFMPAGRVLTCLIGWPRKLNTCVRCIRSQQGSAGLLA